MLFRTLVAAALAASTAAHPVLFICSTPTPTTTLTPCSPIAASRLLDIGIPMPSAVLMSLSIPPASPVLSIPPPALPTSWIPLLQYLENLPPPQARNILSLAAASNESAPYFFTLPPPVQRTAMSLCSLGNAIVADVREAGWAVVLLFLFAVTGTALFLAEMLERISVRRRAQTEVVGEFFSEKAALAAYYDYPIEKPVLVTVIDTETETVTHQ
jgi:hypothetical protein